MKDITIPMLTCSVTVTSVRTSGVGWTLLTLSAQTRTCTVMMKRKGYFQATLTIGKEGGRGGGILYSSTGLKKEAWVCVLRCPFLYVY